MAVRRYFDNAATSFPKPPEVARAVLRMLTEVGGPGRGGYAEARQAATAIAQCRDRIARLVNLGSPEHVVFTHNTTDAINLAIKGVVRHARRTRSAGAKVHIVTTTMEHNSVLRPLNALCAADALIEWTRVAPDPQTGLIDPSDLARACRPGQTVLVCVNHASNVTGVVQDLPAIGAACARLGAGSGGRDGLLLLVDGAQSLGHVPVDMQASHVDLLAFPGHKGLLGPTGTGGLCLRPGVEHRLDTLREGGTGSVSEQETHPATLPEKFEAGSHNTVGIAGLSEAVGWLLDRTIESVQAHEQSLSRRFLAAFRGDDLPGLRLFGPAEAGERRVGVFSVLHEALEPIELNALLEAEFGVLARSGLHCAPLVHAMLGTAPPEGRGTTRLSLGPFLNEADIDHAVGALAAICREQRDALVRS